MKRLIKKANFKTLVIVDIQKDFSNYFNEQYLNRVENLINQGWDKIITVVDMNMGEAEIPKFIYEASDKILEKYYGFDIAYLQELNDSDELEIIEEDEAYRLNKELIIRGNAHEWFNVPEDMELCFKELNSVSLVGGANGECLDDVENALEYLGVEVNREESCIYSAADKNNDNEWIHYIDWI